MNNTIQRYDAFLEDIKYKSTTYKGSQKAFYNAFISLLENNTSLENLMKNVISTRQNITLQHLVSLVHRACVYLFVIENNKDVKTLNKNEWIIFIESVINDKNKFKNLNSYLISRNSQTIDIRRYMAFKISCMVFLPNKPLDILNLGCSINLGFPLLESNTNIGKITDNTDNDIIAKAEKYQLNVNKSISVDVVDLEKVYKSTVSINSYFSDSDQIKLLMEYKSLHNKTKNVFVKLDIFDYLTKTNEVYDAIFAGSILYQISTDKRDATIKLAIKKLKLGGILVINDFFVKNDGMSWFKDWEPSSGTQYKTYVIQKLNDQIIINDFLIWSSSHCEKLEKSKDYDKIINNFTK